MDDFLTRLSHVRQPSARFARNAGALSTLRVTPQGTGGLMVAYPPLSTSLHSARGTATLALSTSYPPSLRTGTSARARIIQLALSTPTGHGLRNVHLRNF